MAKIIKLENLADGVITPVSNFKLINQNDVEVITAEDGTAELPEGTKSIRSDNTVMPYLNPNLITLPESTLFGEITFRSL